MKIKYFFSILVTVVLLSLSVQAQQREVIYTESFGWNTVHKNENTVPYPPITDYTEMDNPVTLSDGGCAQVPDMRFTIVSGVNTAETPLAYFEASGGINAYFATTAEGSQRGFAMNGITIPAYYKDIKMSFGYRKATKDNNSVLDIYYWTGSAWKPLDFIIDDEGEEPGWYRIKDIEIPADADLADFGLKFVREGAIAEAETLRLDDLWFTGVPTIGEAPVLYGPTTVKATEFTASWEAYEGATEYILEVSEKENFASADPAEVLAAWVFEQKYITGDTPLATSYSANNEGQVITTTATGNDANPIPYGSNAPLSIVSTGWHEGVYRKYWQVEVDATGYSNLTVSSRNYSSGNGPRNLMLQYRFSEDGEWTSVPGGNIDLPPTTHILTEDIQLPSACDNQPNVYIRWVMASSLRTNGAADYFVTSGGTSWFGDIYVRGKEIDLVAGYPKTVSETSSEISGLEEGKTYYYRVKATDGENISVASEPNTIISNLPTHFSNQNTQAYFNQANNSFEMVTASGVNNFDVQIMDISGRIINQSHILGNKGSIDANNLPAGVYLISVNIDGSVINFKTIK